MKTITLKPHEMMTASMIGARRWLAVLARKGDNRYSAKELDEGFKHSIMSAIAEQLVAREFNLFWPDGVGSLDSGDVGDKDIEVRYRDTKIGPDIGFKETDTPGNKPFVLVHADTRVKESREFTFTLVGWIYAQDGWSKYGVENGIVGVRFVPSTMPPLRDLEELRSILKAKENRP